MEVEVVFPEVCGAFYKVRIISVVRSEQNLLQFLLMGCRSRDPPPKLMALQQGGLVEGAQPE